MVQKMMRNLLSPLVLVSVALALIACSDDPVSPGLVVPGTYPSDNYLTNTADQQQRLEALARATAEMAQGRASMNRVDLAEILRFYQQLRPHVNDSYEVWVDSWIEELHKSSGTLFDEMKSPEESGEGGVANATLFDEHGVELQQLIEKGSFTSWAYNEAVQIMQASPMTTAHIDQIVALFGASPSFPNSDKVGTDPDRFSAKYAAVRDKNDGTGPYTRFRDAALLAHGAITSGPQYKAKLAEALNTMRVQWERAIAATAVNYLYSTITRLSETEVTSVERTSAMHAFAEGVGFLVGWYGVPNGSRIITDAQVTELLQIMRTPVDGPWTPYQFWQQPATHLPELQNAVLRLQQIYGFSNADMESFRYNWVQVQGR